MFTFNEFGNSLWLLINQAGVAVDGGDSGEIWPWKQTKEKKQPNIWPSNINHRLI